MEDLAEKTKINKKLIGIALAFVFIIIAKFAPLPEGLSREGLCSLMIFISAIVLWICESWEMSISGMLLLFLLPWLGIMDVSECYSSFGGTAFWFVLATFSLTAMMCTTSIPKRICCSAIVHSGSNAKKLVFTLMMLCGLLSAIMSNLATAALFIALVRPIVKLHSEENKNSNLAKCLYIGIPIASNFGGFMTIAGSPSNIVMVNLVEQYAGIRITFLNYMLIAMPMGLISIFTAWYILTRIFKPEPLGSNVTQVYLQSGDKSESINSRERKGILILGATLLCWILSTWIKALDTTVIAILCMVALMAPGINVISWKQFNEYANWDITFVCGIIPALIAAMTTHGASEWIVQTLFSGLENIPVFLVMLVCALLFAILRLIIPTGIAYISFMAIPILSIAMATNTNVVGMMMLLTYWSLVILILPFDPIFMLGYGDGYFSAKDTIKAGTVTTLALIIISALVIPMFSSLAGH